MQRFRVENESNPNVALSSFDAESGQDIMSGPFIIGGVLIVENYEVATFLDLITQAKDHVEGITDDSDSMLNGEVPIISVNTGNVVGLLFTAEMI